MTSWTCRYRRWGAREGEKDASHARVQVGEEAGLLDDTDGRRSNVVERGAVSPLLEPSTSHRVPVLGTVAQREQRLLASGAPPRFGDRHHFLQREERALQPRRRLGERAVVTHVAAQHRQRDEHLPRVRDDRTVTEVAKRRGHPGGLGGERVGAPAGGGGAGSSPRGRGGGGPPPDGTGVVNTADDMTLH